MHSRLSPPAFRAPHRGQGRRSGIALVVVLSFIVLISILVVGFFTSVSTELVGAKTYASNVSTQQLAETAVNVVMGQIRSATTRQNAAWASQPGMIRTYRNGDAAGPRADAFFKLYSSDNMVLTAQSLQEFNPEEESPANWFELPSLFTNLNEPVLVTPQGSGVAVKRYPIIDPSWAATSPYDPTAKIEGFAIAPDANSEVDRARMPARWIYVLKDGTLTVPQADPSGIATWENVTDGPVPTPGNPIVGRIAFWTDDETSKVNINTAGGFVVPRGKSEEEFAGSYWDMPRAYTEFDRGILDNSGSLEMTGSIVKPGLSASQPAQHEFQRYAGHPATTSLGLIFRELLESNPEQLYKFVPRLIGGGSVGGTVRPTAPLDPELPYKRRLYASVDELLFAQKDPGNIPSGADWRRPTNNETLFTGAGGAQLTPEQVDQLRFFLTAHGRASDLNLYGQPRVALWPLAPDSNAQTGFHRTPYDRLIAFCASLPNRKTYYWTRNDPYSPVAEFNITRNREIYQYLFDLTSKPIPGVGRSFGGASGKGGKYGADRDQILTSILDYIRTVNVRQSNEDLNYYSSSGMVVPLKITSPHKTETKGFGRIPTITEVALVFYHGGEFEENGEKKKRLRAFVLLETFTPGYGYAGLRNPPSQRYIAHEIEGLSAFAVSEPTGSPQSLGFPASGRNFVKYGSGAVWHGRYTGGPEGFFHTLIPWDQKGVPTHAEMYPFQSSTTGVVFPAKADKFKFYGGTINISLSWGGVPLQTFKVEFPPSLDTDPWPFPRHEKQFCFDQDPGGFFLGFDDRDSRYRSTPLEQDRLDFNARIRWAARTSSNYTATGGHNHTNRWRQVIQPGDVVRSVEIGGATKPRSYRGDVRLMVLEDNVIISEPHTDYYRSDLFKAYSFRTAAGAIYDDDTKQQIQGEDPANPGAMRTYRIGKATFGKLIRTSLVYPSDKASDIPAHIGDGVNRADGQPGDWDTGMGSFADGAYINKPDEGNVVYKYFDTTVQEYRNQYPYFSWRDELVGETYFSPNRIMPSAVMLGSLPSRVILRNPWETLAFAPNQAGDNHRGNTIGPKDHFLLDLFNMPIVEPYAISEPASTAGRVNLNYQIMPYTHIHRSSALRAAMHTLRVMGVPGTDVRIYKSGSGGPLKINYRHLVDRDETIKSFESFFSKFNDNKDEGFFKSATEICERYLYPKGVKFSENDSTIKTWWAGMQLTGDNTREKPYADLYPRVTTKSNTYTVHMRVQTLRQGTGLSKDPNVFLRWEERPDAILGEYRGSTTIERYIDPNDRRFNPSHPITRELGDHLDPDKQSIEIAHRYRVVGVKRFAP